MRISFDNKQHHLIVPVVVTLMLAATDVLPVSSFLAPRINTRKPAFFVDTQAFPLSFQVHTNQNILDSNQSLSLSERTTALNLFGSADATAATDDELAIHSIQAGMDKLSSLQDYISKWSKLLEDDPKGMGLTTKVKTKAVVVNDDDEKNILSGVQFLFQAPSGGTGYNDKDDSKDKEDGSGESKNKKKKKKPSEGGVEVLVERTSDDKLQVRARRCNMEEETMIKEMSEEAILNELKKAIRIWKKEANVK